MHEWALAEEVISTALKVASEENAKEIVKIEVKVGELQQVDQSTFKFALEELAKGTIAEKAKMEIGLEVSAFRCGACGHEWTFQNSKNRLRKEEFESIHFTPDIAPAFIRCPNCGSNNFEIKEGHGVWVKSVQIKK